jgi:hypothetical protein
MTDTFPWRLSPDEFRRIHLLDDADFDQLPQVTRDAYRHDANEHNRRRMTDGGMTGMVIGGKSVDELLGQQGHNSSS